MLGEEIERTIEASGIECTFPRPKYSPRTHCVGGLPRFARVLWCAVRTGTPGQNILTGPESLSQSEPLNTIGRVIGPALRIEEISPDEAPGELFKIMPSAPVVKMLLDAWSAAAGLPALVTSTVATITGRAQTFFDWATDHAKKFRE